MARPPRDRLCMSAVSFSLMLLGWCAPVVVAQDLPNNPLRSGARATISDEPASDEPGIDPFAESAPAAGTHSLIAAEAPPVDPPSIVPRKLGSGEPALYDDYQMPPGYEQPHGFLADPDGLAYRVHHWFREPWFAHGDPNDPSRHIGLGQPLTGTSWRNRPVYFGAFVGGVLLDDLTDNLYQNDTALLGLRLGYDFDHFWGLEGRWAFAKPELETAAGEPLASGRDYFADVSLLYYPFGDARWRPYFLAGLGFQTFRFNNEEGQRIGESVLAVPLGVGVKYFCSPRCTLRFDLAENIAFGNERVDAMGNFSLMAGVEFRFGGRVPTSYFPWHGNTSYW